MSDFSELLQQAEKLSSDLEGTIELPRVERSLKQVLEASNDLYSRVAQSGSKDIQANLLLGSKGVDLPKIIQKLESISTKHTFETVQPTADVDIASKLQNEIRNKILVAFDSGYNDMLKSTYEKSWEHQSSEWKQHKRQILNALGGRSGVPIEINKQQSILLEKSITSVAYMNAAEAIYSTKIVEYNTALVRGLPKLNLVNAFCNIANDFKDSKVSDMWEIIKYMIQLPPFSQSEDPIKIRHSKPVVEALVTQARKYLENRYKTYMNNIINENLRQANKGGIPGTYPLVKSYVGLRYPGEYLGLRDGNIDDRPLWPMVYYCLRAGDLAAAIYCLNKSNLKEYSNITSILEAKLKNANSVEIQRLEDDIRYVRNETDPFKRMIWSVLGCCDVTDEHSDVAKTADDYLWLKLSLVRVDYNKDDYLRYDDLQLILEEYGETHYDALNQPHLYFQVLALTGQFEAAIDFLSRIERFKVHAVHMAIALNELSCLAGPHDVNAPLTFVDPADPKPARRINLARLIRIYVRTFELNATNEALHYFYYLRNYKNSEGESLFKVYVADLVIETRDYERILGRVQQQGVRTKGLIDQFTNISIKADSIAQMVADKLVKKGLYEEAIDIYDIADNQEEILTYLCTMLSQVVQCEKEPGSLRDRLQQKAILFADRFSKDGYRCSNSLISSFLKIKDLVTFFDLYHSKNYEQALEILSNLQIIPFQQNEITDRVKSFKLLSADLCKIVPDVLLATMNILFAQYQKIKGNIEYIPRYQDDLADKQLSYIREQAKTITNFAGMFPYRMPGDTNSKLVQMEILMH